MCKIRDKITYSVDKIQLPVGTLKRLKGYGVCIVVQRQSCLNASLHHKQTLGPEFVWQDLNGVSDEETRPGHGVHDVEDPDEGNHRKVGTWGTLLLVQSRCQGPKDEGDEHAARGGEEGWASAELVDEHCHGDRDDESDGGDAGGQLFKEFRQHSPMEDGETRWQLIPSLVVELVILTPSYNKFV